jgi:hypothetical protein
MGCLVVMTPHMLAVPGKSSESSAYWPFSRERAPLTDPNPGDATCRPFVSGPIGVKELGRIIKAHTLQHELPEDSDALERDAPDKFRP